MRFDVSPQRGRGVQEMVEAVEASQQKREGRAARKRNLATKKSIDIKEQARQQAKGRG